jgi:hypothetical protein
MMRAILAQKDEELMHILLDIRAVTLLARNSER